MARVFQDTRQKRELGKKAPWCVEWRINGKRYSKKVGGKMAAEQFAKEVEAQILRGEFGLSEKKQWKEFREEYERIVLPGMRSKLSRREARHALNLFETIVQPTSVQSISQRQLDAYVAKRREMTGVNGPIKAATIRKELRGIRAALTFAHRWKYLGLVPSMPRIQGFESEKHFVSEQHFLAMLKACKVAQTPNFEGSAFTAEDWWRALLALMWVVPLRIQAMLELRWKDVDFQQNTLLSLARYNKQKKDQRAFFPSSVARFLEKIQSPDEKVFSWPKGKSALYRQFRAIQQVAGIKLPCDEDHDHTAKCYHYGFHDFRRAFATYNRDLPAAVVQGQMGHSDYSTTLRYECYGRDHSSYADRLHVPESLGDDV